MRLPRGGARLSPLLAPGDAYHSTAAVLSAVDTIASTCAASIEISLVGTAGEWPLKLVKLGADAPSKRRVLLTFGMHGRVSGARRTSNTGSPPSSASAKSGRSGAAIPHTLNRPVAPSSVTAVPLSWLNSTKPPETKL